MKTTTDISKKLKMVELEINRISNLIDNGKNENEPFIFSSGKIFENRSMKDELISNIAQKFILEWVLNKN
jgi:hypothetical protein